MKFDRLWFLIGGVLTGLALSYALSEHYRLSLDACQLTVWPNGAVTFSQRCSERAVIALEDSGAAAALVSPD